MWVARDAQREGPGSFGQTGKYRIFPLEPILYSDGSWGVPGYALTCPGAEIREVDTPVKLPPGGGPVEVKLIRVGR